MMIHDAIYTLNPTVVTIHGDVAYDKDGNEVTYNRLDVQAYIDANKYKEQRTAEYPSIQEQLDTLYHGGLAEWKATIKAVKDKYPKPE